MLTLTIPARDVFNEKLNEFTTFEEKTIQMEHSLISLSKWEEKWHEPYLGRVGVKTERTHEQNVSYMECMTLTKDLPPGFFDYLDPDIYQQVVDYINDPHTATTFTDRPGQLGAKPKETITAEIIYYWMFQAQIPLECQKWHLSKLLTLLRVFEVKNAQQTGKGKKRMSRSELAASRRELNAQRRSQLNTNG